MLSESSSVMIQSVNILCKVCVALHVPKLPSHALRMGALEVASACGAQLALAAQAARAKMSASVPATLMASLAGDAAVSALVVCQGTRQRPWLCSANAPANPPLYLSSCLPHPQINAWPYVTERCPSGTQSPVHCMYGMYAAAGRHIGTAYAKSPVEVLHRFEM